MAATQRPAGYSLFSGLSNILLSVLGAGQLTLPYALEELGWVAGLGFLGLFVVLGVHSLHSLAHHSIRVKSGCGALLPRGAPAPGAKQAESCGSYAELAVEVLGPGAKVLCDVLLAAYAWGGAVSFMVILKGELAYLLARAAGRQGGEGAPLPAGALLAILSAVVIWPLSARRDPGALRRFSPLGCIAALLITAVVLASARWEAGASSLLGVLDACSGPAGSAGPPAGAGAPRRWPKSFMSAAAALPLLSFALNSSWAFLPILAGLRHKSPRRVSALIWAGSLAIGVDYALLALVGYASFCGATDANILISLGDSLPLGGRAGHGWHAVTVLVARAALAVQLTLALPLRFFVARSVLPAGPQGRRWPRWGLAGLLVASAAGLAATPLPLAVAIGFTSSICASVIIYILPAVIDLKSGAEPGARRAGTLRRALSALSLPVGLFVLVAGALANLMGVSKGA